MESRLPFSIVSMLAISLVLASCGGSSGNTSFGIVEWPRDVADVGAHPGQLAPNFRLELANGGEIELAEELGTPILLNFFASWCTNCREEMAALDAVAGDDVRVIGIDFQESEATVLKLAEETGATFPMGLDRNGKVSREYRATSLPVTLLISADGRVLEYVRGPVDGERLDELIALATSSGSS